METPEVEPNPWDTSHIPHGYDDRDFKEVVKELIKRSIERQKLNEGRTLTDDSSGKQILTSGITEDESPSR
jgi:hypothetical protein